MLGERKEPGRCGELGVLSRTFGKGPLRLCGEPVGGGSGRWRGHCHSDLEAGDGAQTGAGLGAQGQSQGAGWVAAGRRRGGATAGLVPPWWGSPERSGCGGRDLVWCRWAWWAIREARGCGGGKGGTRPSLEAYGDAPCRPRMDAELSASEEWQRLGTLEHPGGVALGPLQALPLCPLQPLPQDLPNGQRPQVCYNGRTSPLL